MAKRWESIWEEVYGDKPIQRSEYISAQEPASAPDPNPPKYDKTSLVSHFVEANKNKFGNIVADMMKGLEKERVGSVQDTEDIKKGMLEKRDNPLLTLFQMNGSNIADRYFKGIKPGIFASPDEAKQTIGQLMSGSWLTDAGKERLSAAMSTGDMDTISKEYLDVVSLHMQRDQRDRYTKGVSAEYNPEKKIQTWGENYAKEHPLHQVKPGSPEYYAQGLGSMAPSVLALGAAAATLARTKDFKASKELATIALRNTGINAKVAEVGGTLAAHGAYQWWHSAPEAFLEKQGAYEDALKAGLSEQQAVKVANRTLNDNILLLGVSNTIEDALASGALPKMGKAFFRTAKGRAVKTAIGYMSNAAQNSVEEYWQTIIPQAHIQKFDSSKAIDYDEAERSAIIGGVGGMGMHAAGRATGKAIDTLRGVPSDNAAVAAPPVQQGQPAPATAPVAPAAAAPTQEQPVVTKTPEMVGVPAVISSLSPEKKLELLEQLSANPTAQLGQDAQPINMLVDGAVYDPAAIDEYLTKYADNIAEIGVLANNFGSRVGNVSEVAPALAADAAIPNELKDSLVSTDPAVQQAALEQALAVQPELAAQKLAASGATYELPKQLSPIMRDVVSRANDTLEYDEDAKPFVISAKNGVIDNNNKKALVDFVRANGKENADGKMEMPINGGTLIVSKTGTPSASFLPKKMNQQELMAHKQLANKSEFDTMGQKDNFINEVLTALQKGKYIAKDAKHARAAAYVAASNGVRLSNFKKQGNTGFIASVIKEKGKSGPEKVAEAKAKAEEIKAQQPEEKAVKVDWGAPAENELPFPVNQEAVKQAEPRRKSVVQQMAEESDAQIAELQKNGSISFSTELDARAFAFYAASQRFIEVSRSGKTVTLVKGKDAKKEAASPVTEQSIHNAPGRISVDVSNASAIRQDPDVEAVFTKAESGGISLVKRADGNYDAAVRPIKIQTFNLKDVAINQVFDGFPDSLKGMEAFRDEDNFYISPSQRVLIRPAIFSIGSDGKVVLVKKGAYQVQGHQGKNNGPVVRFNSGINPFQIVPALRKYEDMTVPEAWRELKKLGKQVYESGITNGQKWTAKMKEVLGDLWGKVRPHIGKLWKEVKATLSSNRGSVSLEGLRKQVSDAEALRTRQMPYIKDSALMEKAVKATGKTAEEIRNEFNTNSRKLSQMKDELAKAEKQQPVKQEKQETVKQETKQEGWARTAANGYEVSSKGNSAFSAFNAKLADGRTIEEAYQLDVKGYREKGGKTWRDGKGKPPINGKTHQQLWNEYLGLWEQWAKENPQQIEKLRELSAGKVLTDMFATTPVNQAHALSVILDRTPAAAKPATQQTVKQENNIPAKPVKELTNDEAKALFKDAKAKEAYAKSQGIAPDAISSELTKRINETKPKSFFGVEYAQKPTPEQLQKDQAKFLKEHGGNVAVSWAGMPYRYEGMPETKTGATYAAYGDNGVVGLSFDGEVSPIRIDNVPFYSIKAAYEYVVSHDDKTNLNNLVAMLQPHMEMEGIKLDIDALGGKKFIEKLTFDKQKDHIYLRAILKAYDNITKNVAPPDIQVLDSLREVDAEVMTAFSIADVTPQSIFSEGYKKYAKMLADIKKSTDTIKIRTTAIIDGAHVAGEENQMKLSLARVAKKNVEVVVVPESRSFADDGSGSMAGEVKPKTFVSYGGSLLMSKLPNHRDRFIPSGAPTKYAKQTYDIVSMEQTSPTIEEMKENPKTIYVVSAGTNTGDLKNVLVWPQKFSEISTFAAKLESLVKSGKDIVTSRPWTKHLNSSVAFASAWEKLSKLNINARRESGSIKVGSGTKWETNYLSPSPEYDVSSVLAYVQNMPEHLLASLGELTGARLIGDGVDPMTGKKMGKRMTHADALIDLYNITRGLEDGKHTIDMTIFPFPVQITVSVKDGKVHTASHGMTRPSWMDRFNKPDTIGSSFEDNRPALFVFGEEVGETWSREQEDEDLLKEIEMAESFADIEGARLENELWGKSDRMQVNQDKHARKENIKNLGTTRLDREASEESAKPLKDKHKNTNKISAITNHNEHVSVEENMDGTFSISLDSLHRRVSKNIALPHIPKDKTYASDVAFMMQYPEQMRFITAEEAIMAGEMQRGNIPSVRKIWNVSAVANAKALDAIRRYEVAVAQSQEKYAQSGKRNNVPGTKPKKVGWSRKVDARTAIERDNALVYLAYKYAPLAVRFAKGVNIDLSFEEAVDLLMGVDSDNPNKVTSLTQSALGLRNDPAVVKRANWPAHMANVVKNIVMTQKRSEKGLNETETAIANRFRDLLRESGENTLAAQSVATIKEMAGQVMEQLHTEISSMQANKAPQVGINQRIEMLTSLQGAIASGESSLFENLIQSDTNTLSSDRAMGAGGVTTLDFAETQTVGQSEGETSVVEEAEKIRRQMMDYAKLQGNKREFTDQAKITAYAALFKEQKQAAMDKLNYFQQVVADMYLDGVVTAEDIAAMTQTNIEDVRTTLERIFEVFRETIDLKALREANRPKVAEQKTEDIQFPANNKFRETLVTGKLSKTEVAVKKALQMLGIDNVHFFDQEGGPNGVYLSSAKGRTIFLNRASSLGVVWTAGHELGHYILEKNPGLHKQLSEALGISDQIVDYTIAKLAKQGLKLSRADAVEELICDELGNSMLSGKAYDMLFNGLNKPVYVRAMRSVVKFVKKITGKNKLTGLTDEQSKQIEQALVNHLNDKYPSIATDLVSYEQVISRDHANLLLHRLADGKTLSKADQQALDEIHANATEANWGTSNMKFSLDSEVAAGTWRAKLFGKIPIIGNRLGGKQVNYDNIKMDVKSSSDPFTILDWLKSPNLLTKKSPILAVVNKMAISAQNVQERLQRNWTGRLRNVLTLEHGKLQAINQLWRMLDSVKREPVMAVRLKDGRYTMLGLQDLNISTTQKATAIVKETEMKKRGYHTEIVEETHIDHNDETVTTYTVLAFKQKPSEFFSEAKDARISAQMRSEEAMRKGITFGGKKDSVTIVCDEEMIGAYRQLRSLLDDIHESVNTMRRRVGMDPVGYIHGYMPHMFEDYWVYLGGESNPVNTFRTSTDAIEAVKAMMEKNRIDAEANLSKLSAIEKQIAELYYGITGTAPVTEISALAKKLGMDQKAVHDALSGIVVEGRGFARNTFRIAGRPAKAASLSESNTIAFASGDMLETYEQQKLLDHEGMSFADFESRYGMMQEMSEYKGEARNPSIVKGRGKNMTGYIADTSLIMNRYINQAARYVAMNPFKLRSTSLFRNQFGVPLSSDIKGNNEASYIKSYIQCINGDPCWLDVQLGNLFEKMVDSGIGKKLGLRQAFEAVGGREVFNHILFFTSVMKLGLNVSSAFLNFTQLGNTFAVLGLGNTMKVLPRAAKLYYDIKSGRAKTMTEPMTGKTYQELFDIFGLDTQIDITGEASMTGTNLSLSNPADFVKQVYNLARNDRMGLAYEAGQASLSLFKLTDAIARITTTFATLEKEHARVMAEIKKENIGDSEQDIKRKTLLKVAEMADHNNRICNFDNSKADSALGFYHAGKAGAVLLQFKKYQFKTIELLSRLVPGKDSSKEDYKKFGKFLLMQSLLSGFYGIPLYKALLVPLAMYMDWEEPETEFKKFIWTAFGGTPLGDALAGHLTYGAGYHVGMDLSRRTGYDFLQFSTRDIGGPAIGTGISLYTLISQNDASLMPKIAPDMMQQVFPGVGGFMHAYKGDKYSTDGRGRLIYRYSPAERLVRTLGARPVNESFEADVSHYADYYEKKVQKEQQRIKDKAARLMEEGKPIPPELKEQIDKHKIKTSAIAKVKKQAEQERSERMIGAVPKKLQKEVKDYLNMGE
jgi:hypothetical protein